MKQDKGLKTVKLRKSSPVSRALYEAASKEEPALELSVSVPSDSDVVAMAVALALEKAKAAEAALALLNRQISF